MTPTAALALCASLALALPSVPTAGTVVMAGAHDAVSPVDRSTRMDGYVSWRATDLDGRTWTPDALRGRVVLVDFWATWCAPCLEDLPRLKRLHARFEARGLTIIGVSLDRSPTRDFRAWLQRQAIGWPQVREAGGYDGPLVLRFGVEAVPASFLFDRDGRLRARNLRGADLDARVAALVEGA